MMVNYYNILQQIIKNKLIILYPHNESESKLAYNKKIDKMLQKYKGLIKFTHVRSHTGKQDPHSLGNEQADKLATSGAMKN